jgi:hypothetical protein
MKPVLPYLEWSRYADRASPPRACLAHASAARGKSLTYGIRRVRLTAHETAGLRPKRQNNSSGSSVRRTPCRPTQAAGFHDRPMLDNRCPSMVAGARTPRSPAAFLRANCRDHHSRSDVWPATPPRLRSSDRRRGRRRSRRSLVGALRHRRLADHGGLRDRDVTRDTSGSRPAHDDSGGRPGNSGHGAVAQSRPGSQPLA